MMRMMMMMIMKFELEEIETRKKGKWKEYFYFEEIHGGGQETTCTARERSLANALPKKNLDHKLDKKFGI